MKVGFNALSLHKIHPSQVAEIGRKFYEQGFELYFSQNLIKPFEKGPAFDFPFEIFSLEDDISGLSLLLSLGGDGTILDTLLYGVPHQVPIIGVNFGRLGFLPNLPSSDVHKVISLLKDGKPGILERTLLEIEVPDGNPFQNFNFALNEVALTKKDSSSMITIQTFLNQNFLNEYWGDGLIVSTPTGSTGYSLSCGGPIVWPESKGLVLTPISPHNLSMRPIVLPDDAILDLVPRSRQHRIMLSMDSRSRSVSVNQAIRIRKSSRSARFLAVPDDSFSTTLREKLFWGKDLRN